MRTDRIREIERNSKRKKAAAFRERGLNTRGHKYRRTPNLAPNLSPEKRSRHNSRVNLARYHRRAQRRLACGLSTRGTPRIYISVFGPGDAAVFDAEILQVTSQIARVYEALPKTAQAGALQLAHSLGNIRKRIKFALTERATS
jgi:hypothetical protein